MPSPTPGEALIDLLTGTGKSIVARLAKSVQDDPNGPVQLGHFTEADFPGYQPVTITDLEDVAPDSVDAAEVLSAAFDFEASGLSVPQAVVAVYVTQHDPDNGAQLYDFKPLDPAFAFRKDGDKLTQQVRIVSSLDF